MSPKKPPKKRFLGVEHQVIVEEDSPYFLGDELHASVKVRNLEAETVKKRFCYILRYPGGMEPRTMEFVLGPNEEKVHPLYDNKPPYYLGFMGSFQIIILKGEEGRRFNEKGELKIPPGYRYDTLFPGNVRDRDGYELRDRTTKAVEMMGGSIDAIKESNKSTLYLTIAVVVMAVAEILTLVVGLVVG